MKNQVEMTPHKLETWVAILSCFETTIVNRALLEIGLSEDPFPDVGKVVMRCEQLRRQKAGRESSDGKIRIGDEMLQQIAQSMGLKISDHLEAANLKPVTEDPAKSQRWIPKPKKAKQ